MTHYRDPLAGLRSQVATKRGLALARQGQVTPLLMTLLPPALRDSITEAGPRALAEAESLEALSAADGALDALLVAQDQALALAPKLRELAFDLRDPPPPDPPAPWLIEESALRVFREGLEARVREVAGEEASLVRWGDFGYLGRFRHRDAPWTLCSVATIEHDTQSVFQFTTTLRTTMPERLPRLEVTRERGHHVVGKALGLARELDTGDAKFDAAYWIKGDAGTATLLARAVREGLLRLAGDSPRLVVASGVASLAWTRRWFPIAPQHTVSDEAVAILLELQDAAARV